MTKKVWYTYDDIHKTVKQIATRIQEAGERYDAMIAIGGGGFIPARMLRCFLDIPIYAVTTAYYLSESSGETAETVRKIQWLDPLPEPLRSKNVLVVDEVDDSRTTLAFCLRELQSEDLGHIGVAVLHNKLKPKCDTLPAGISYYSGIEVEDWWINYPWDANDIDAHNRKAETAREEQAQQ